MDEFNNDNSDENLQQDSDNFSGSDGGTDSGSDFAIPEEYKEKGWAKFFDGKTGDDLKAEVFRSYENSQTLIGKKVEDYLTTADLKSLSNYEQIKEHLVKQIAPDIQVPENAEDYALNDILKDEDGNIQYEYPQEVFDTFGGTFKDLGLSKEQGQGIVKAFTDFEIGEFQKYTNPEELESNINQMFSENQGQRKTVEGLLKEFLPEDDQQFLQKTAPNHTIEMFYRVAQGLVNKYGFKEGTNNSSNPSKIRMSEADRNAEYDKLCKQLEDIDSRPQKVGEKDAIVKRMRELFQ